jgi:hypothetical protein
MVLSPTNDKTVIKNFHVSKFSIQRSDVLNRLELKSQREFQITVKNDVSPRRLLSNTI